MERQALPAASPVKALGRPTVNAARMWQFFTRDVYRSGDLVALATREALQNSVDALRAAVRARQARWVRTRDTSLPEAYFDVTWNAEQKLLTFQDNGIGMDEKTIQEKFLSLGETTKEGAADSGQAAGGFGVAKAVILGVSPTFRWEMATRNNLVVADGVDKEIEIRENTPQGGTLITLHDVDLVARWDYHEGRYRTAADRIGDVLALNDLPDIVLSMNHVPVKPRFSAKGGTPIKLALGWGPDTTAKIRAFKRADGRGSYYVRLNGLYQFHTNAYRNKLTADVVIDLHTTRRPGQGGYPVNAARDAFQAAAQAAWRQLAEHVERENESTGRNQDYQEYDDEAKGAVGSGLHKLLEGVLKAVEQDGRFDAARRHLPELADEIKRLWAPAQQQPGDTSPPRAPRPAAPEEVTFDVSTPEGRANAEQILIKLGSIPGKEDIADKALEILSHTGTGKVKVRLDVLEEALEEAIGRGLEVLVPAFPKASKASKASSRGKPLPVNPFAPHGALLVSKKKYSQPKAKAFLAQAGKWLPHLALWDVVLRFVSAAGYIQLPFKAGFILDDQVHALWERREGVQTSNIYIHPDTYAAAVATYRDNPIGLATWLHTLACHELVHMQAGTIHAKGHDERFVSAREDLAMVTSHLIPTLAQLAVELLKLPPFPEQQRILQLEQDLVACEAGRKVHTTPGTRSRWSSLADWLVELRAFLNARASEKYYMDMHAHFAALPDSVVELGTNHALDALRVALDQAPDHVPQADRVRLLDAWSRATQKRASSAGRKVRGQQLLDLVVKKVREAPGVDREVLDLFLGEYGHELRGLADKAAAEIWPVR